MIEIIFQRAPVMKMFTEKVRRSYIFKVLRLNFNSYILLTINLQISVYKLKAYPRDVKFGTKVELTNLVSKQITYQHILQETY